MIRIEFLSFFSFIILSFLIILNIEHAVNALNALDGTIVQGRLIHILPAKQDPHAEGTNTASTGTNSTTATSESDQTSAFKQKKEKERKAMSGNSVNWNSLFMNVSITYLLYYPSVFLLHCLHARA